MCLAMPMKIIKAEPPHAVGEAKGLTQNIRIDFVDDISVGDYVLVHAGFAIQKMGEDEAMENIRFLEELADEL